MIITHKKSLESIFLSSSDFNKLKQDFIIQITDEKIHIYFSNLGSKGEVFLQLNSETIVKSKLNTLVVKGDSSSSGQIRLRGIGQKAVLLLRTAEEFEDHNFSLIIGFDGEKKYLNTYAY